MKGNKSMGKLMMKTKRINGTMYVFDNTKILDRIKIRNRDGDSIEAANKRKTV